MHVHALSWKKSKNKSLYAKQGGDKCKFELFSNIYFGFGITKDFSPQCGQSCCDIKSSNSLMPNELKSYNKCW